jgi:hypothetical protein
MFIFLFEIFGGASIGNEFGLIVDLLLDEIIEIYQNWHFTA